MAAIKITTFLGVAPKISPELLPNTAGQIAKNCKLYSGDLIPYPQPVVVGNTGKTGTIKTLYALRNPSNPLDLKWLSWTTDVDIAVATATEDDEQRFYFTGDGVPKVSNYELATTGVGAYPIAAYDLGLPLPDTTLTTVATAVVTNDSVSRERDTSNIATLVTLAPHNYRTGNVISITGFPAGTTTVATFNATNVEITVINATTFTYFSPGEPVTTTLDANGRITLAGLTQARSYLYTWFTPWLEESIGSEPSDDLYIKEGQTVTVSSIPTAKPTGNNFIRGVRLYRTLPSVSGTEYFLLSTLWFPTALTRVARTSNVSTVTTGFPHNLSIDDRFKISGCTVASFDITGGIVLDVLDDYTFTYAQVAANVTSTTVAAGTLYHDVSENPPTSTARYWGDGGNYDFIDDFDSRNLNTLLSSDDYDAPPENLEGLAAVQNNILVGFVGNKMYFSQPGQPHAWPQRYAITIEHPIVGIAAIGGSFLVTTTSYPYLVSGNDPAARMAVARIDANFPCLNRKSMVTMGYGIVYATHEGLAVYSPSSGPQIITKALYNSDTWNATLNPTTINAQYYNENYLASHSTGGIVFEQDTKTGGFFTDNTFAFTASWYDTVQGKVFVVAGTSGDVYEWDDLTQPALTMEWKSKVIITKDMLNLGAVRVIADYATPSVTWDEDTTQWQVESSTWDDPNEITFTLWVDKQQIFQTSINDDDVFRLPTGYRSDTFEVGVTGNVRVRAIHLGETPTGLRLA